MFSVSPIAAFNDNYIWQLKAPKSSNIVVVDPGDAAPVIAAIERFGLTLTAILVTHHHQDHTGGIAELTQRYAVPVYGPENSPCSLITNTLKQGDRFNLLGQDFEVLAVPAHTLDHIAYVTCEGQPRRLFCGDTLFMAGCGRLFEGTPAQMLEAMTAFSALPDDTEVYCAHEYTLANLRFAQQVEPNNPEVEKTFLRCRALRNQEQPTLPSTIGLEKQINPFMRTTEPTVKSQAEQFAGHPLNTAVDILAAVREWKNQN